MKKYILMFGLTLVMGLFIANSTYAQTPPWTQSGNWWTLTGNNWISVDGRLRAFDRVVTPVVVPTPGSMRFDLGMGSANGANLEMYHKNDVSRPGEFRFVYGGGNYGLIQFIHYNGSSFTTKMSVNKDGNLNISGKLDAFGADVHGALTVDGKITSTEIEVKTDVWSDFVFYDDYYLRPLCEVEKFIKTNRHLPDVPSESEVLENGVNVGQMSAVLLQKIEELTLYIIELNKRIEDLEK